MGKAATKSGGCRATANFIHAAQDALVMSGAYVSVTAFGLTCVEPQDDLGVGQKLENYTSQADYVSPAIYPAEWGNGAFNLDVPAQHPFEVVGTALHDSLNMVNKPGLMRPWLEGYSPPNLTYGVAEIKGEIQAASPENAPGGWLLWNPNGQYDAAYFQAKPPLSATTTGDKAVVAPTALPHS